MDASGAVVWQRPAAHAGFLNVVLPFGGGGHMLASGDDDGGVKVWDTRAPQAGGAAALAWASLHDDLVNDLLVDAERHTLLSASGDGTLGVVDLRKAGRLVARTEQEEDELLSLVAIKGGDAVVAGTQDGVLLTWKWGKWTFGDRDEEGGPARFTGHPQSIDALLPVDDDAVVTGSSDGIIRLVTVAPNKLVGVLGEHGEDPIERLAWSRDRQFIASAGHDETLKFWNVGYLFEDEEEEGEGEGGAAAASAAGSGRSTSASASSGGGSGGASAAGAGGRHKGSRFAALPALAMPKRSRDGGDDDDSDDEDDEDDDDEEEGDDDDDGDEEMEGGGGAGKKAGAKAGMKAPGKLKQSRRPGGGSGGAGGRGGKGGGGKAGFFNDL